MEEGGVLVPMSKFLEMDDVFDLMTLSEKHRIRKTVMWENQEYVIVGGMGQYGFDPWICLDGHVIIDLHLYKGELDPMHPNDHQDEVNKGNRERGYNGQLVKQGKRDVVMTGERVTFYPIRKEEQLTLF